MCFHPQKAVEQALYGLPMLTAEGRVLPRAAKFTVFEDPPGFLTVTIQLQGIDTPPECPDKPLPEDCCGEKPNPLSAVVAATS